MTDDKWTLITVTYNSAVQLRSSWSRRAGQGARWIVVDNESTDGSPDVAEELGADVVRLDRNIGFAAANNVGLSKVVDGWVAFVNPDVRVGGDADLTRLRDVSLANGWSLVAPQLLNSDGTEQPNARGLPFLIDKVANRSVSLPGSRLTDYARTDLGHPVYVAWVIGAALAGSVRTFRELGGWDESFFVYYEDHDIGLRAWRRGVAVVVDPSVRWEHEWQRATTLPRVRPWLFELRAGRVFYRRYPYLLRRRNEDRARHELGDLTQLLWLPAQDPS